MSWPGSGCTPGKPRPRRTPRGTWVCTHCVRDDDREVAAVPSGSSRLCQRCPRDHECIADVRVIAGSAKKAKPKSVRVCLSCLCPGVDRVVRHLYDASSPCARRCGRSADVLVIPVPQKKKTAPEASADDLPCPDYSGSP